MSKVLPILFNTDMVRAILDGKKTATRRVIKYPKCGYFEYEPPKVAPRYRIGDILYVRETWSPVFVKPKRYLYKVGCDKANNLPIRWHPSIHMPKEAARIWLKVTDVRVERLSRMLELDFQKEGISPYKDDMTEKTEIEMEYEFQDLWNSTIKKSEIMLYGWDADPWVFVYEFEICEKPKEVE